MLFIASSLTKTHLQTVVLDVHLPNPDGPLSGRHLEDRPER